MSECAVRPRARGTVETPHAPLQRASGPWTANRPPLAYPSLPRLSPSPALHTQSLGRFFLTRRCLTSECPVLEVLMDKRRRNISVRNDHHMTHVPAWIASRVCPSGRESPAWGQPHDLTAPKKAYAPCCESPLGSFLNHAKRSHYHIAWTWRITGGLAHAVSFHHTSLKQKDSLAPDTFKSPASTE